MKAKKKKGVGSFKKVINKFSDNFQRPLAIPHVNSIIISLAIEALILE